MNKTALKNFAIYARNKLREDVAIKAGLIGAMPDGIKEPLESRSDFMSFDIGVSEPHKIFNEAIKKREALVNELKEREKNSNYKTAYESIIEEVAYTWFNRIIALRFMEVNNYIPDHIRVLSSGNPKDHIPEIINHALDTDLEFSDEEKEYIVEKKLEASTRALEELYQFLFLKKCNKLNEILPELFEKTEDYKELLITVSYSDTEGVIYKLINEVPEEDFDIEKEGQVEIIGWLYQYYNEERKNEVDKYVAKKGKVQKEDLPAKTQLFTPDWIVRYMTENSLGRLIIEDDNLKYNFNSEEERIENETNFAKEKGWKYYIPEAKQDLAIREKLKEKIKEVDLEEIKLIDIITTKTIQFNYPILSAS